MPPSVAAPASPEELFLRWRDSGDAAAMAAVFDAEAPVLFRTAVALASDPVLAEEAVQETFLAAMESADRWDDGRRVGPWLTGILRIKILELRRRNARRPDPRRLPPPPAPEDPVVATAMAEDVERVRAAIRALPEPYRSVALLRWVHGLEPAAIADLRGEPPGTVWSLLSRAMAKLRRGLGASAVLASLAPAERGMEGVRATVLERARALRPVPGGTPARGRPRGSRIPASLAGLAAILLLGAAGWWALAGRGGAPAAAAGGVRSPAIADAAPGARAAAEAAPARGGLPPQEETAAPPAAAAPPGPPEPSDPPSDVTGIVLDGAGRPVPGASVTAWFRPYGDVFHLGPEAARSRAPGPAARTGPDGTFRLPLRRGASMDLRAEAPGLGLARLGWRVAGERVRMVLRPPPALAVRASDEEGRPVAGLVVSPSRMDESGRFAQLPAATTDADGRALLPEMEPGTLCLQLEHPLFRGRNPLFVSIPAEGTLEHAIPLVRGVMVEGEVVDADTGMPVEGAVVGEGQFLLNAVTAGPDGRFRFPFDPLDGRRLLQARAPGYALGHGRPGGDGTIRVGLRRGWAASGRIVTPEGEPVAGARVTCRGRAPAGSGYAGPDSAGAVSDGEGRFRLETLRRGTPYTLIVDAEGRGRLLRDFAPPEDGEGERELGDVAMAPGRSIEGTLLGPDGNPLGDAPVYLDGPLGSFAASGDSMGIGRRTDARGRFRFGDRSPGAYRVAAGTLGARISAAVDVRLPEDGDVLDVLLRLPAGDPLTLVAVDPAGNPLPGILFTLLGEDFDVRPVTDGAGRARVVVPPGRTLTATCLDPLRPVRWIPDETRVEIPPGTAERRFPMRPAGTAGGIVVDAAGEPVDGAVVTLRDPAGSRWSGRTGPDGRFSFAAPLHALLEARAEKGGRRSAAAAVEVPAEDLRLVLPAAGR